MKKRGFTLIELLAVIIILAVIALIATPVVLNVVENAKKEANKNSVYGLLDGAKLYYAESLLNESPNINGTTNLIDEIKVSGNKPDSGVIYINENGEMAIAVVYDDICYTKNFSQVALQESSDITNCTLGVDETPVIPSEPSKPEISYKCKRATKDTLHTEECTQTEEEKYCVGTGYTESGTKGTKIIKYGNEEVTLGMLVSGDAFDCDVNGDGVYDASTERFYYVSDLYDTTNDVFNNDYAVLIYYSNTTLGIADYKSSSEIGYYSTTENFHGPVTAITNLPTTIQWGNITLSNTSRAILTEIGTTVTGTSSIPAGGTLPSEFSYSGYAARLLTAQELNVACNLIVGTPIKGELDDCTYLLENTKYSNSLYGTNGYWLETPKASSGSRAWYVLSSYRYPYYNNHIYGKYDLGVRPVIEVLKTDIEI